MTSRLVAAALALVVPIAGTTPADPAARLEAIKKDVKEAETAFRKVAEALPDTPEGEKKYSALWKAFDKKQSDGFLAAVELAKADPKSPASFDALEWVLTTARAYYLPAGKPALALVTEHYAADPRVGKIVARVGYNLPEGQEASGEAAALIDAVRRKNPDRAARGQAVMALAWRAVRRFAAAESGKAPDTEAKAAEAEKALEVVVKDYADCPRLMREGQRTLGEEAGRELFELRHLRVGKQAPDIKGEDLDGKRFKLSDYRGRVVVLDFWGNW